MGVAKISFVSDKAAHFKLLVPILLAVACYAPVLDAPFVWDDEVMVEHNHMITSWHHIGDIFTTNAFGGPLDAGTAYRPVQIVSYLFDYHIWGLNSFGFRLTNLILHCLSVAILCRVLLALGLLARVVFWTSVVFAIHPLCIESITYIAGRGDALCMTFGMLSVWMFCKGANGRFWWHLPSWLFFGISVLAKENGLPIPILMALAVMLLKKKWRSQNVFGGLTGFLAIIVGFLWFRFGVLPPASKETLSAIAHASLPERILTIPYILFTYCKIVLLPHNLHMEYHHVVETFRDPYLLLGLPAITILSWMIYRVFQSGGNENLFLFFLGWFLVGLGPVSQVLVPLASTLREHWLYLPGIGLIGLLTMAGSQLVGMLPKGLMRWALTGIGVGYVMFLGGTTIHRNLDWTDAKQLFSHDLKLEPNSFLLHNNLGLIHMRNRDTVQAKASFKNALAASPNGHYDVAHNNLGVAYLRENRFSEAESQFIQSIKYGQFVSAYLNLATLYLRSGSTERASQVLAEATKVYPYHPGIRDFLIRQKQ